MSVSRIQRNSGESAGFTDFPTELRLSILEASIFDESSSKRTILLGEGFKLSANAAHAYGPSDSARILNLRQSCYEANELVTKCIEQNRLTVSPVTLIKTTSESFHLAQASRAREGLFDISVHKDVLYLERALLDRHIREFTTGFGITYTRAPWSMKDPEERPINFMMDLTSAVVLLEKLPLAVPGNPTNGDKSAQAFLLSLGITAPFFPYTPQIERIRSTSWIQEIVRRDWRNLEVAPTTLTIVVPTCEADLVGTDIDMNDEAQARLQQQRQMHVRRYDNEELPSGHLIQPAVSVLGGSAQQREQLDRTMMAWNELVDNAAQQSIDFPIQLQFLRRGPLGSFRQLAAQGRIARLPTLQETLETGYGSRSTRAHRLTLARHRVMDMLSLNH